MDKQASKQAIDDGMAAFLNPILAKTFYRLTTEELDTLPYWEFENENNPAHPGRSYVLGNVKLLVYRKLATLAGLHKAGVGEQELLRRGMRLFDEA